MGFRQRPEAFGISIPTSHGRERDATVRRAASPSERSPNARANKEYTPPTQFRQEHSLEYINLMDGEGSTL